MTEDVRKALITIATGLAVSILGGVAGYMYRESFDAPRLSIQYARLEAPEEPIRLSESSFRVLKIDGNVMEFVGQRVSWNVREVVWKNEFSYQQIGEMRELLPKLNEQFQRTREEEAFNLDLLQKALARGTELMGEAALDTKRRNEIARTLLKEFPQLSRRLAASRNYYRSAWNLDIFDVFYDNPVQALRKFIPDSQGDLTQTDETIQTISTLTAELEQKWKAGTPNKLRVVGSTVPEVKVTVVISNTGRTDAMIKNTGSLTIGNTNVYLIRFDRKAERRRRSYEFDKVPAGGTLELDLAFDTERNTSQNEQTVYADILKGVKTVRLALADIAGNSIEGTIEQ